MAFGNEDEDNVRRELHHFIDHEMDVSIFEGSYFGLERIKREMHWIASYIDIRRVDPPPLCTTAETGNSLSPKTPSPRSLQHHLINETKNNLRDIYMRQLCGKEDTLYGSTLEEQLVKRLMSFDDATRKEKHQRLRTEFLERADLQPPRALRVIDIEATCLAEQVVLLDYCAAHMDEVGFSAISHTFGMDVYEVFDCCCTSTCFAKVPRGLPKPCAHEHLVGADSTKRDRVVADIMRMCATLKAAGVHYAWHDGVCIAQHDEQEVQETIKHIGWIYAYAMETIIFLHYVGSPMSPVRHGNKKDEVTCRWHTRVWTLQEAALSRCRRYCVRVGSNPLGDCQSLKEFEEKIALWYRDDSSKVDVIEEKSFLEILLEIYRVIAPLHHNPPSMNDVLDESSQILWLKANSWYGCIIRLLWTLNATCLDFPTVGTAIELTSARDSKHVGDRINSILALAEVKHFVAPKDVNVEASTLEFFKRQGRRGLQWAVFASNYWLLDDDKQYLWEDRRYTWLPILWRVVRSLRRDSVETSIEFTLLEDGKIELRGKMLCVEVRFTSWIEDEIWSHEKNHNILNRNKTQGLAKQDLAFLDMDLTSHDLVSNVKVSLQEAPASLMGIAIFPFFENQSAGLAIADGREITRGESFHAYLVLPQDIEADASLADQWPSLVVQGNLLDHVSKIGCFMATDLFICSVLKDILNRPAVTFIKMLVMK